MIHADEEHFNWIYRLFNCVLMFSKWRCTFIPFLFHETLWSSHCSQHSLCPAFLMKVLHCYTRTYSTVCRSPWPSIGQTMLATEPLWTLLSVLSAREASHADNTLRARLQRATHEEPRGEGRLWFRRKAVAKCVSPGSSKRKHSL